MNSMLWQIQYLRPHISHKLQAVGNWTYSNRFKTSATCFTKIPITITLQICRSCDGQWHQWYVGVLWSCTHPKILHEMVQCFWKRNGMTNTRAGQYRWKHQHVISCQVWWHPKRLHEGHQVCKNLCESLSQKDRPWQMSNQCQRKPYQLPRWCRHSNHGHDHSKTPFQ